MYSGVKLTCIKMGCGGFVTRFSKAKTWSSYSATIIAKTKNQFIDTGPYAHDGGDDYPDYIFPAAEAVAKDPGNRGLVFCGTGVGASITANKVQ